MTPNIFIPNILILEEDEKQIICSFCVVRFELFIELECSRAMHKCVAGNESGRMCDRWGKRYTRCSGK